MLKKVLCFSVLFFFVLMGAVMAMDFSADTLMKSKGQPDRTAKMFMSNDKWRIESNQGGKPFLAIYRGDKKLVWMVMPDQKMYMENKFKPEDMVRVGGKTPGEIDRKNLGKETINGISCDKYLITYKTNNSVNKLYQWISGDKMPIKTAALDGSWSSEMKNINKGNQPASLFELPAGYKKFAIPGMGMMKGIKMPANMPKMGR